MAGRGARALLWAMGAALAAGLGAVAVDRLAPPQDRPWKPLTLAQPIGLATHFKIARDGADLARCRAILADGGVRFKVAAPYPDQGYCSTKDAGGVYAGLPTLMPAHPVMTCRETLALAVWVRQSVRPAARNLLGSELMGVEHFGTYACRAIRGENGASEHARANAIDISAFRLGDGRRVSVAASYREHDPRGVFLRRIHADACRVFAHALGPKFNAAHHDHLHLDMGAWSACR